MARSEQSLEILKQNALLFRPTLKRFVSQYTGLCINTFLIYILFFALGVPNVAKYGYPGTQDIHMIGNMSQTKDGSIASGVFGSGIFPFSLFLFVISTIMLLKELICYFWYPSVKELERRVDYITISKRMGSMRLMSSLHKEDMMSVGVDSASLNPAE